MKLWIAGMFAGLLLFPQGAAAQTKSPDSGVVRETLSNGMRVILIPDNLAPVVTTVMSYGVGSDDDTAPGIAHATEHMMFRGTADLSAGQFAIIAARAGAQYNAQTNNVCTSYYFELPAAYAGLAFRLEADRMNGARMLQSDWEAERGAIEQEVRAHESIPGAQVFAKMRHALYGDTPYAEDGVGTVESFQKMRADDIAAFYRTWYHPNNATLIVAGDIDVQQTLAQIHQDFDSLAQAELPQHRTFEYAQLDGTILRDTVAELPIPVSVVSYRMPSLHSKDYMAGQVFSDVLNSVRAGFGDLQAKGQILGALTYAGAYPDVGTLMVLGFGQPGSQPQSVESAIKSVLDRYRKDGVPPELIESIKQRSISTRDYQRSSISGLALSWSTALTQLGDDSPDDEFTQIASVTPDDVNRVVRAYVDPSHSITLLLQPKSLDVIPQSAPASSAENVQYTPDKEEPLPAWAAKYFRAPLQAPRYDSAVTFVLKNGLHLTVKHEDLAPTVSLRGSIRTSPDLYQPRGKDGVADITRVLLSWGTASYNRVAYQAAQDSVAANISLGPAFKMTAQSRNFDRAMQLLADGLLHPAFSSAAFQTVKGNALRTLAAEEHQPSTQAEIARTNALYPPGDPRRRRATPQTVADVGIADVKDWYRFAYRPDLTTIAVVGDVPPQQVKASVEHYFGQWRRGGNPPTFEYPEVTAKIGKSVSITSPTATQTEVTLAQVLDVHRGDADYIPLELADEVLSGEGISSMLFRDLREKTGYVYDVTSDMSIGWTSSSFSVDFASDPKNVSLAEAAIRADIKDLQTSLIPADDLQRAKALIMAERVLPLDSYDGIAADILDTAEIGVTTGDDRAFWASLLRTTPEQVRAAARRWLRPNNFTRVIVSPEPQ